MEQVTNPGLNPVTRRSFLLGAAGGAGALLLSGCVGSGTPGGNQGGGSSKELILQNSIEDPAPEQALEELAARMRNYEVTVNSVATEQFRAQLSTYLTSSDPPDVLTWYAGPVANSYAEEGLLLDVSSLWRGDGPCANFSSALRSLSTSSEGQQIFVPTFNYWWSLFYKKSAFESWGVEPVDTWEDFLAMCETLKRKGVSPLTQGIGSTPWMASGWFDYLNLRVNGARYHRELLAGEHSFTDRQVVEVMEQYRRLIPYFHPNMASWDYQQASQALTDNSAAMYLTGAFTIQHMPADQRGDLDFFSVPTIDPSVPSAEEAPTDGFFASANTDNPEGSLALLDYLASPQSQQAFIEKTAQDGAAYLPTSPEVDTSNFTPILQKGMQLLRETEEITQFFNRDSSDEMQAIADTALTKFLDNPGDMKAILAEWQQSAETAR
ncbi:MAG: extracellular solute-binding protein [Streptosporangiales bacterium]|nr:extracellular solute-binding protein [Streptosporangiales bacterium]